MNLLNRANQLFGVHSICEALTAGNPPIERIYVGRETRSPKLQEVIELAGQRGVPVRREDRNVLERMAPGVSHQGIIALCGEFRYSPEEVLFRTERSFIV